MEVPHANISAVVLCPLKEEFHEILIGVSGKKNPVKYKDIFNQALLEINDALAYEQFELRACRNQYDGHVYYGVVNNVADEQSKLGTKYLAPQIAFYKGVIEAINNDGGKDGTISIIDALNVRLENQIALSQASQECGAKLPTAFKLFNVSQKEKTLQELIKDKWLCQTSSDQIGLGIRSFFDLRGWFRTNEVPSCDVCNEAGVKACVCPKEGCLVRIHDYCLQNKFSNKTEKFNALKKTMNELRAAEVVALIYAGLIPEDGSVSTVMDFISDGPSSTSMYKAIKGQQE